MKDLDRNLLFEAYRKIYEAPVDPGEAWDTDDVAAQFDSDEIDRLKKYQVPTPELINDVVDAVKAFLSSHENSHYDGTFKEFRVDIIQAIRDSAGIGKANAGYVSRVVTNALKRLKIISIDGATQQVTINDVDEKEVEKEVEKSVERAVDLQYRHTYEINRESGVTPDSDAYKAHDLLLQKFGGGFSATGRDIINVLRAEMSLDEAKTLANELLQSDGIFVPEEEEDTEDKVVDVGGEVEDSRYAADDYWERELGGYGLGSSSMSDY